VRRTDGTPVTYGDVRLQDELHFSVYNFELADVDKTWQHLNLYEEECRQLLAQFVEYTQAPDSEKRNKVDPEEQAQKLDANADLIRRFPLLSAYDLCLKCSHLFNLLDARGAISVTERVGVIARIRALAVGVAKAYMTQQRVASMAANNSAPVAALSS
jgi:glycyl-tRNA synthetase alpha chain